MKTAEDRKLFFNEMWAHNPNNNKKSRGGGTVSSYVYITMYTILLPQRNTITTQSHTFFYNTIIAQSQ